MFKLSLLIVTLAFAAASAQEAPSNSEAAPEPYSYGYETDTHAAAEQRDPSGKVTGFYTITGDDGRQRRVEYIADEAGFRAKVQTNEVGTKSANSADVEVLASPPNAEQLVVREQQQQTVRVNQPQLQQQQVVSQVVSSAPQVRTQTGYSYYQQPQYSSYGYGYGYYPGYESQAYGAYGNGVYGGYGNGFYGTNAYRGASYGNGVYGNGAYRGAGYGSGYYGNGVYSSYNNHLPSSYYKSIQSTVSQPSSYSAGSIGGNGFVSGVQPGTQTVSTYRSGSYQTVGGPSVGYSRVVPGGASYSSSGSSSSNLSGSSNYIVLKKRESSSATAAAAGTESKSN